MLSLLLACTVCGAPLASEAMVTAPNRLNPLAGYVRTPQAVSQLLDIDGQIEVPVGPPEATLVVSLLEPEEGPPRGTILMLHGLAANRFTMLPQARKLSAAGYRVALVDLRGHGESTGELLTYGVRESRDLSQVIDELMRRKLCGDRVGVYGISYGAATAIQLAGIDRRVAAVVALAPFATMRGEVPEFAGCWLPGINRCVNDEQWRDWIDDAGRRGGFDPDAASPENAVRSSRAGVLLVHGTADRVIPVEHSRRIHAAAPETCRLMIVEGAGHVGLWFDCHGEVATAAQKWFDDRLAERR